MGKLLLLAGLQNISTELREAAQVDGAAKAPPEESSPPAAAKSDGGGVEHGVSFEQFKRVIELMLKTVEGRRAVELHAARNMR